MGAKGTKIVKVIPYGGLCNRLLFMNSIIEYATKESLLIKCYWFMNSEMYASALSLFDIDCDIIKFVDIDTKHLIGKIFQFFYKVIRKLNLFVVDELKFYDSASGKIKSSEFVDAIKGRGLVTGCLNFYDKYSKNNFIPKDKYVNIAKSILKGASDNDLVTIHIRRTDHIDSITNTTNDKVIKIISDEIKLGNKVFVACDDLKLKSELTSKYPNSIITQNVLTIDRNMFKSIEYALIDLLCLGYGKVLYGSYNSTFSAFAAFLGNTKLIIIK